MDVRLLIDTRERSGGLTLYSYVSRLLTECQIDPKLISSDDVKREQLLFGDFCFLKKVDGEWQLKLVVERKTIGDLQASFTDGRLEEQKAYLLELRKTHNIPIVYIVEGDLQLDCNDRSHIRPELLESYLVQLDLESIPVKRPQTPEETCVILFEYVKALQRNAPIKGVPMCALAGKSRLTSDCWWANALALIPRVSLEVAEQIAEAYPTQARLLSSGPNRIRELKRSKTNRRLGEAIEIAVLESVGHNVRLDNDDEFWKLTEDVPQKPVKKRAEKRPVPYKKRATKDGGSLEDTLRRAAEMNERLNRASSGKQIPTVDLSD